MLTPESTNDNAPPSNDASSVKPDMECALRLVKGDPVSGRSVAHTDGSDPWYSIHDCLKSIGHFAINDERRRQALRRALDSGGGWLRSWTQMISLSNRPGRPVACMQIEGLAYLMGVMCPAKWDSATEKGTRNKSKGGKRAREEGEEDDFFAGCGPIPEAAPSPEIELQILQAKIKLAEVEKEKLQLQLALIEAQKGQSTGPRSPRASTRPPSPTPPKPKPPAEPTPPAPAKPKPPAEPAVPAPAKKSRDSSQGHSAAAPDAQDSEKSFHEKQQERREQNRQRDAARGHEPDMCRVHPPTSTAQKQPRPKAAQEEAPRAPPSEQRQSSKQTTRAEPPSRSAPPPKPDPKPDPKPPPKPAPTAPPPQAPVEPPAATAPAPARVPSPPPARLSAKERIDRESEAKGMVKASDGAWCSPGALGEYEKSLSAKKTIEVPTPSVHGKPRRIRSNIPGRVLKQDDEVIYAFDKKDKPNFVYGNDFEDDPNDGWREQPT